MTTTLDTLVATVGMGWPVIDTHTPLREAKPHGGFVLDGRPEVFGVQGLHTEIFHPSTNIAHAMMLADHLAHTHDLRLSLIDYVSYWQAHFGVRGRPWDWKMNRNHANRCTAICLAAMAAIGVPEEKIKEAMDGQ